MALWLSPPQGLHPARSQLSAHSMSARTYGSASAPPEQGRNHLTVRGFTGRSVVDELGIPIKFVGVGETVDDLQPFDAAAFVDALFPSVEQAALAR